MASRKKKVGLALLALLALLVAFVGYKRATRHVWNVASIKESAEYQDGARLRAAYALPVAARYESAGLVFQPNGSICGPTSIANVARSWDRPGATPDAVLEGTGKCRLFGICVMGLTLEELADVARSATHKKATVLRDLSAADFREHLLRANDPTRRYVVNFDRGPLFGGADAGHHSPIGGYLEGEDLVLVLDVNETFKPWLVRRERLFEAVDTVDPMSGMKRGLLLLE